MSMITQFSPMEQYEIYQIGSLNISFNNIVFYQQIGTFISIFPTILNTQSTIISNWMSIQNESLYRTILSMVIQNMGSSNTVYFPLIYSLFFQIFFSNVQGQVPYSSTPTVEFVITLSMSFTLQIGILIIGIQKHKTQIVAAYLPSGLPLALVPFMLFQESLAYLIKIMSLGLRLAINLTTGHILVKVSQGFIYEAYTNNTSQQIQICPQALLTMFICQEIQIAYLQSFIFTFIVCITFKEYL